MTSQTARTAAYFARYPGKWIAAPELMLIGGKLRWRTSCSELRRAPYFMRIVNRQRTITLSTGEKCRLSEYRFEPTTSTEETSRAGSALPDSTAAGCRANQ